MIGIRSLAVDHVSITDVRGGAARAAHRVHEAVRSAGLRSRMLVEERHSEDPDVELVRTYGGQLGRAARIRLDHELMRLAPPSGSVRSLNLLPTSVHKQTSADIVNLHWVGAGMLSTRDLARVQAPVVMTLHDMWAFSGTEHYGDDSDDARWVSGYPRLPGQRWHVDLDRVVWRSKKRRWPRCSVVTPSRWLGECAARSALMHDWTIRQIPYPIDLHTYQPRPATRPPVLAEVPPDAAIVLFTAIGGADDDRKGFDLLLTALAGLEQRRHLWCVVVGQGRPHDSSAIPLPVCWTGAIDDDGVLASVYSAADVAVVPSRQDNLPQTAIEAQCCGTPVVAFDVGGLRDIVEDLVTGRVVPPFDTAGLRSAIEWVLEDGERQAALGEAARRRALQAYDPHRIGAMYTEVYIEAIEATRG